MSTYSLKCIQENEEKSDKFKTTKRVLGAAAIGGAAGGGLGVKAGFNKALNSEEAQNKIDLIKQGMKRGESIGRMQGTVADKVLPTKPSEFDEIAKAHIPNYTMESDAEYSKKQKLIELGKKYAIPSVAAAGVGKLAYDKLKNSTNDAAMDAVKSISDKGAFRMGGRIGGKMGETAEVYGHD